MMTVMRILLVLAFSAALATPHLRAEAGAADAADAAKAKAEANLARLEKSLADLTVAQPSVATDIGLVLHKLCDDAAIRSSLERWNAYALTKEELAELEQEWQASSDKASARQRDHFGGADCWSLRMFAMDNTQVRHLVLVDKPGRVAAMDKLEKRFDLTNDPLWKKAMADGKGAIVVSDKTMSATGTAWVQPFAVPILDAEGTAIGVIMGESVTAGP